MSKPKSIRKILIANRGEIACRIILTAKTLGIKTVAVTSFADCYATFAMIADQVIPIGPAPAAESYLDIGKILAAAIETGANAIHPGYGFLAENAAFAEACQTQGIIFIGPAPEAIRAMGLKDRAKTLMEKAGVPVVPGYHGARQDPKFLAAEAKKIGYPLMIKAVAGGGGKGMRLVKKAGEFAEALKGARREAANSFGNDRVLLEKYLETPRHIEVQVFGDAAGNVVHLFERDCSIQRRHQKIIEEAPAPGMTDVLRERLTGAAVRAAKAIHYENAGTIEFIVDAAGGLTDQTRFYFMEMNTRLQVEHPVTEMVTGLDLVEWQILIAEGKPLPLKQNEIKLDGHAVEARLYAEDPDHDFLPQSGTICWQSFPDEDAAFRLESGYGLGDQVTVHYDPMMAKLITWGETRESAIVRLKQVLEASEVAGIKTNLAFLAAVCGHRDFLGGNITTHFIEDHDGDFASQAPYPPEVMVVIAALTYLDDRREERQSAFDAPDPWSPFSGEGWRMNHDYFENLSFVYLDQVYHLRAEPLRGTGVISFYLDGDFLATGHRQYGHEITFELQFADRRESIAISAISHLDRIFLIRGGRTDEVRHLLPEEEMAGEATAPGTISSPMPGRILEVLAKNGQNVTKDTALIVMEAMKMEYTLRAPRDGQVKGLEAKAGAQVSEGQILLEIV
ncbi:MAG: acetyl/propionyl/methylcrotonyl-CoA carboxylase subunit alpha [Proteobacteria bacterium]|nr:acetyl/propionyl/methylcrotonyl-CoA carboxylase subunit alpha [Pseudomonadota bacterium]